MTVTIVQPTTGDPFGPGFQIAWSTDTVGPFEPGSFWRIDLTSPAGENIIVRYERPYVDAFITDFFRQGTSVQTIISIPLPEVHEGDSGRLRFQLIQPTFGVADEGDVTVTIDRQTGQNAEQWLWTREQPTAIGAGLTESEHNAVLQTNVGVIAMAGINPLDMIGDLAAAFASSPPLAFGSLSTTYVLSGDGEMPDIGDVLHTKLAIYFVATTIPAGLGHRHGQSEEYPSRLVQWRTVHTVDSLEVVTEVLDFITHGELWKWRQAKPLRIEYSILPGVVLAARWWQFP